MLKGSGLAEYTQCWRRWIIIVLSSLSGGGADAPCRRSCCRHPFVGVSLNGCIHISRAATQCMVGESPPWVFDGFLSDGGLQCGECSRSNSSAVGVFAHRHTQPRQPSGGSHGGNTTSASQTAP